MANYLGNYQSSVNYALNDAVSWQGSTYISLLAGNQGNTPSLSPTQWTVLAAQGPIGPTGLTGAPGSVGATGPAGAAGAPGPQGPPVTFRGTWLIGTQYALGDAVAYENSSYIALQSNTGREPDTGPSYWALLAAAGSTGLPGATGAAGPEGPTGLAGAVGPAGPQGSAGPAGPQGPQGPTGQTGPQGLTGPAGTPGATGATGIPGTNGTNGLNGAPGPPGVTYRGAWTAGSGYALNDAVTYGNPASTYIAIAPNSSAEPDLFTNDWSLLAQAGSVGPSGPTGAVPTLAIGTVTTGSPGTPAAVSLSGTASAAILNFTIPQGAAGPPGGGNGGSGNSGIQAAGVYHSVQNNLNYPYYSVNNPNSSATESGLTAASFAALTWVPTACTASALSVFSEQNGPITVTLRVGSTPANMTDTSLVCSSVAKGASCSASGSVPVPAGSFVDFSISGADNSPSAVWTALSCN